MRGLEGGGGWRNKKSSCLDTFLDLCDLSRIGLLLFFLRGGGLCSFLIWPFRSLEGFEKTIKRCE